MSAAARNAEVVRRAYRAFNEADMATLTETFHEKASWHTPGNSSVAGDAVGRAAVFAQFGCYEGETKETFRAVLKDVFYSGAGRVVGVHHNTAERGGKRLDTGCRIVFDLKDGRIIDDREHFFDLYNGDAFWS